MGKNPLATKSLKSPQSPQLPQQGLKARSISNSDGGYPENGALLGFGRALGSTGVLGLVLLSGLVGGCGGGYYGITVGSAQARLEEARLVGAEQRAPYEYYYAKAHLDQAAVEAGEASYSDAARYAEVAEEYATKAVELSRADKRRSGGGSSDASGASDVSSPMPHSKP